MSNNYDLIATVDIDVANPISDDSSFDSILIVGPLPSTAPSAAPALVAEYKNLEAVEDAGWVTSGDNADPVGIAANIAFSQSNRPASIWIAPIQTTESVAEGLVDTVKRAIDYDGWYVICPVGVEPTTKGSETYSIKAQYEDVADYIETKEKMFCYTELDALATASALPTVSGEYYRTIGVYGKVTSDQSTSDIPENNLYVNVAFSAEWLTYASGSETAAFKKLTGISPSILSSAEVEQLVNNHLNYIVTIGNRCITMNGITIAGEWCDVIRFRDWLKNDMQHRVVNLLISNPKIPYTDSGIALVQNQMLAALKAGQDAGGIAEEEFDENGNSIPGYVTSVPLASSISADVKASRKLYNCKFKARIAGAIHFAEIKGSLTYGL